MTPPTPSGPRVLYISGPYSAGNGRSVEDNIAVARAHAEAAARQKLAAHMSQ